jgi:actin-like ATPase involved in cell morphogenesis
MSSGDQYKLDQGNSPIPPQKKSPGRPKKVAVSSETIESTVQEKIDHITLRDRFALAALAGGVKDKGVWSTADYVMKHRSDVTKNS